MIDLERRWIADALCSGMDQSTFYPDHTMGVERRPSRLTQLRWDQAKRICERCPVRSQCARDTIGEREGVWGGRDPHQRFLLRRTLSDQVPSWGHGRKMRIGALIMDLRGRSLKPPEVSRIIGLRSGMINYLADYYQARRTDKKITVLTLPGDRPPPITEAEQRRILNMHRQGEHYRAISEATGRSIPGIRRVIKRAEEKPVEQSA